MMDTVGSLFFNPLVLRNRSLPLGVFAGISTRTTQTERFFRRRKAPTKTASLSLGASQQLEVRQLFDLLKTCLRWEARLLEVLFFPLSPVTKFGMLDGSVPSLWGKVKIEMGITIRSLLGLLLITATYSA